MVGFVFGEIFNKFLVFWFIGFNSRLSWDLVGVLSLKFES